MNEPVADAVRSILDGHIVLSRKLAAENHYPAVDVLGSISRVMRDVIPEDVQRAVGTILADMAVYRENEDLINIGAYKKGSNPRIDQAIDRRPLIQNLLIQQIDEPGAMAETWQQILEVAS